MRVGSPKQSGSTTVIREPEMQTQQLSHSAQAGTDAIGVATPAMRSSVQRIAPRAAGRSHERRSYARVRLSFSLRVRRIAGQREDRARALRTLDVSSSGVYFLSPRRVEPGTPIQLELLIVDCPFGRGSVRMCTEAHVVRADKGPNPGWYGLAAAFDDISFLRDAPAPSRFQRD
jgi:hypothetical protein